MDKTTNFDGMTLIGNIKGEKGDKGDTGASFKISEFFDTHEKLEAVENPSAGDAYGVGSDKDYDIYVYSPTKGWVNNGAISLDINERTPNFEEATGIEIDNINIESATTISEIFGKIKRAISELISHLKNKTNPHNVTTEQIGAASVSHTHTAEEIGAIPKRKNIVIGDKTESETSVDGGIKVGFSYVEDDVPYCGVGTERGSNSIILTVGCNHTNYTKETELGARVYYYPVEYAENILSFPAVLKLSHIDGGLYLLQSKKGLNHYSKDEILEMNNFEVIHSGNIRKFIKEESLL